MVGLCSSVVDVANLGCLRPRAVLPGELLAYPAPHPPVIDKLRFPSVRDSDADQLILIVVIKATRSVARQISVEIIDAANRGRQIHRHRVALRYANSHP